MAGAGARAAACLLAMACSSSMATAGLFDMKLLKEHQYLQLEHAGKIWSFPHETSRGRVGSACCGATLWCVGRFEAGAFVMSVRAWEQHVCAIPEETRTLTKPEWQACSVTWGTREKMQRIFLHTWTDLGGTTEVLPWLPITCLVYRVRRSRSLTLPKA